MHHTDYHRPASVDDVSKLLDQHGDDKLIDLGISDVPMPASPHTAWKTLRAAKH
jgi:hypothetical protein